MIHAETRAFSVGSVQRRTVVQLLFCHCLIIVVALFNPVSVLPVILVCLLSFLFLLNISYSLNLLEIVLDRLARGLAIEPVRLHGRWSRLILWPVANLFRLVNALARQSGQLVQLEQRNVAYRDQLLQQVSKTAAQEERNRLARDLHDSIKQQLFSIVVSAAAVKARWDHNPTSARKVVDDIERTALEAQLEMQALLQQLRPTALENVGLIESLRMQCQALGYRTGATVTAELGELPSDELFPLGAQEMIFRIVQEGFANVARHARATHVWLSLQRQRDFFLVEIGDNGQGFELAQADDCSTTYGGMGLSNVRERVRTMGGTLSIWSQPGKGTTLHLSIPLVKPQLPTQAQEQTALQRAIANKTRRILHGSTWATELAAALVLLYTPALIAVPLVGICLIVALAFWLLAQQSRLQLVVEVGREHVQNISLLAQSYALLAAMLLLTIFYSGYFIALDYTANTPALWLEAGLYGIGILAIVALCLRFYQFAGRYDALLSYRTLHEEVRQQFQQLVIDWMVWAIAAILVLSLPNYFPLLLKEPSIHMMSMFLLSIWCLFVIAKSLRIAWRYRVLRSSAKQSEGHQKEGDL